MIKIAVAKGRVARQAIKLFNEFGITFSDFDTNRKLILDSDDGSVQMVLVKPSDTPIYVESGVCDCGIVGKDILLEDNPDVYRLLPLNIGKCKMCVCGYDTTDIHSMKQIVVASKFVNIAKSYFDSLGMQTKIIKINGSVELAPILHMSDVIVDIVESGETLRENGLSVLEEIVDIYSVFIVNKASLKMKHSTLKPFIDNLKNANERLLK